MGIGGQKRTRSERVAALELPPNRWERAVASFRRRDVLVRLGMLIVTAIILCGVIQGWQPPFPYRQGDTLPRDLAATVTFQMPDPAATEAAQARARWQVKYTYVNDPEPLEQLCGALRNRVSEVMAAASYADLIRTAPTVWPEFEPSLEKEAPPRSPEQCEESYRKFHDALVGDQNLAGFEESLKKALATFAERGLIKKLRQKPGEGNQNEITVYPVNRTPEAAKTVQVGDVLIGNLIGKGSPILENLQSAFGSRDVAEPVFNWLRPRLTETLLLDNVTTQKALDAAVEKIANVEVTYERGQTLAEGGMPLRAEQLPLLRAEYQAAMKQQAVLARLVRAGAVVVVFLGLFALCVPYTLLYEPKLVGSFKRLFMIEALVIITVAVSITLAGWPGIDAWRLELIPLLLFGQTVAIAYRQELALLLTAILAMIIVLGTGTGVAGFLLLMGVTATAILQLQRIRSRKKLIYVGLSSAAMAVLLTLAVGIVHYQPLGLPLLWKAGLNGAWTVAAGFLMTGLLPFIESLFGVLTDISLLELGDVAHPLLQELIRRAPSTYNHSITVGSIAEAAAEAIGARGLLVRVGAYFHDIGKMLKPGYFIENQSPNENRHDSLVPAMSTLVIIAHIKDGADLARQHNLPEPIIDFIEQHHGTTLVEFFFGRANQQAQQDPNSGEVDESSYRYPGPRPQTKESGVLMLADAVESASRSLVDPTPARIESLVREIAERKLDDSQFDESGLTLRELRTIENTMIKSLTAIYHGRVKYPDQKTA